MTARRLLPPALAALLTGCAVVGPALEADDDLEVRDPPPAIVDPALRAAPGLAVDGVEMQLRGDDLVYDVEGTRDGAPVSVIVSGTGRVLDVAAVP
jgi:uncharacterized membrane protein YkoI